MSFTRNKWKCIKLFQSALKHTSYSFSGGFRGQRRRVCHPFPHVGGHVPLLLAVCPPLKGTKSSRSEQTFNRAWNRCPSLRWTQGLEITGSFYASANDLNMRGIIFSHWVIYHTDSMPCWSWQYCPCVIIVCFPFFATLDLPLSYSRIIAIQIVKFWPFITRK